MKASISQNCRTFPDKFPENPDIVKFPKRGPFNTKVRKFWEENLMKRNFFLVRVSESLAIPRGVVLFSPKIPENAVPEKNT